VRMHSMNKSKSCSDFNTFVFDGGMVSVSTKSSGSFYLISKKP